MPVSDYTRLLSEAEEIQDAFDQMDPQLQGSHFLVEGADGTVWWENPRTGDRVVVPYAVPNAARRTRAT